MNFSNITLHYLDRLKTAYLNAEITRDFTPEMSYKPILDNYFHDIIGLLAPDAEVIFEPSQQEKSGRPDWRFYEKSSLGTYGYIEGKKLQIDAPISLDNHTDQIKKYLQLKSHLILTDA